MCLINEPKILLLLLLIYGKLFLLRGLEQNIIMEEIKALFEIEIIGKIKNKKVKRTCLSCLFCNLK